MSTEIIHYRKSATKAIKPKIPFNFRIVKDYKYDKPYVVHYKDLNSKYWDLADMCETLESAKNCISIMKNEYTPKLQIIWKGKKYRVVKYDFRIGIEVKNPWWCYLFFSFWREVVSYRVQSEINVDDVIKSAQNLDLFGTLKKVYYNE